MSHAISTPERSQLASHALGALALLAGCASPPASAPASVTIERMALVMGTSLSMQVTGADRAAALAASELALRTVEAAEARLSTWSAESELSRLLARPPGLAYPCSSALASELDQAAQIAARTVGAFDPTVAPLVAAWDLRGAGRRPSQAELLAALSQVGFHRLRVQDQQVRFEAGTHIEEGGFGKGAALDAARTALAQLAGIDALLDLGGQVALSSHARPRLVPLAHSDQRDLAYLQIMLHAGESMATSANTVQAKPHPGGGIGHLLDPRSGLPATDFGSVTVICRSALAADALSTALFVMGPEAALAFAERQPDLEALILRRAPQGLETQYTSGLEGRIHSIPGSLTEPHPSTP